jgi:hypothetical protein
MEILNYDTLHTPDRRKFANCEWKSPARGPRLDRLTIGFWLGGGVLGMGGCILGVCMPYHHLVALMISALWWGFYLGCFGGSVGALIALFTKRAPAPASRGVDGRGLSVAPATIPAACSVPQEEQVACYIPGRGDHHLPETTRRYEHDH